MAVKNYLCPGRSLRFIPFNLLYGDRRKRDGRSLRRAARMNHREDRHADSGAAKEFEVAELSEDVRKN